MKRIDVGQVNDLTVKAVEVDGRYFALTETDLEYHVADVEIGYDSGVYPGVTLETLPQYICDIAAVQ